jgi:hypothetical protein
MTQTLTSMNAPTNRTVRKNLKDASSPPHYETTTAMAFVVTSALLLCMTAHCC